MGRKATRRVPPYGMVIRPARPPLWKGAGTLVARGLPSRRGVAGGDIVSLTGRIRVVDSRGVPIGQWTTRDAIRSARRGHGTLRPVAEVAVMAAQTAKKLRRARHPAAKWMSQKAEDFSRAAQLSPEERVLVLDGITTDVNYRRQLLEDSDDDARRDLLGVVAGEDESPAVRAYRLGGSPVPRNEWRLVESRVTRATEEVKRRVMWRAVNRKYVDDAIDY